MVICTIAVQVEAEEVEDLAERYDVSAVPHFLIFKVCSTAVVMLECRSTPLPLNHCLSCVGSCQVRLFYRMVICTQDGKVAAAVEGADPAALTSAVTAHLGGSSSLPFGGALPAPNGQLHPTLPSSRQPPPEAQVCVCSCP